MLFLSMWDGVARTRTDVGSFRPKGQPPAALNGGIVLPYADTPMVEDTLCADLYLQMITNASVGSCNLDYRSFYLQFENGVWLCGDPSVIAVRDDFLDAQRHCQEITQSDCDAVSPVVRLKQAVYRLFSPLF